MKQESFKNILNCFHFVDIHHYLWFFAENTEKLLKNFCKNRQTWFAIIKMLMKYWIGGLWIWHLRFYVNLIYCLYQDWCKWHWLRTINLLTIHWLSLRFNMLFFYRICVIFILHVSLITNSCIINVSFVLDE